MARPRSRSASRCANDAACRSPPRLDRRRRVVRGHRDVRDDGRDAGRSDARRCSGRTRRPRRSSGSRAHYCLDRGHRRPVRLLARQPRARRARRELPEQARGHRDPRASGCGRRCSSRSPRSCSQLASACPLGIIAAVAAQSMAGSRGDARRACRPERAAVRRRDDPRSTWSRIGSGGFRSAATGPVSVSNGYDAKGLLKQAIRYEEDPVIFMESEVMYGDKSEVPEEEYYIELGKADIKKQGQDVTIVSFNKMMKVALAAANELEKEDINAEVIDLRTIRPLDWMTVLESVKKTNRLVIVAEEWPMCGVASELAYRIQKEGFDYLDAPVRRITSADAPMHYAPNLVAAYLPDVPRTVNLVKEVMYMKK